MKCGVQIQGKPSNAPSITPSGLPWAESENPEVQNKKYNGKEFVEAHGYDTYDYGARGYYSAIMRFTSIDPLAEKYYSVSPYAYCNNNPVIYIDPNGKWRLKVNLINIALTSGFLGAELRIGAGGSVNIAPFGGVKQETGAYILIDSESESKVGIGGYWKQTECDYKVEADAGIINGSSSNEKGNTVEGNTIDGDISNNETSYSKIESGGLGVKGVQASTNEDGTEVNIEAGAKANVVILGVEVKTSITYTPTKTSNVSNSSKTNKTMESNYKKKYDNTLSPYEYKVDLLGTQTSNK